MSQNPIKGISFPSLPPRGLSLKCVYSSLDEACSFCSARDLHCEKVPGPKTQVKQSQQVLVSQTRHIISSQAFISPTPSLINDTNRSTSEIYYIRFLHSRFSNPSDNVASSIILQNLWREYGLTFEEECLQFAALCFACVQFPSKRTQGEISYRYYQFKAKFHANLRRALADNRISECHLFALYLVIESLGRHWSHLKVDSMASIRSEAQVFQDGFLRILAHCDNLLSLGTLKPRLRFLWGVALAELRRNIYLFPGQLREDRLQHNFSSEMFVASRKLLCHSLDRVPDLRIITQGAVAGFNPGWWGLGWLTIEGFAALHSFFFHTFQVPQNSCRCVNVLLALKDSLEAMRHYVAELCHTSTSSSVRQKVTLFIYLSNYCVVVSKYRTCHERLYLAPVLARSISRSIFSFIGIVWDSLRFIFRKGYAYSNTCNSRTAQI
jgi:hypothetical protein